VILGNYPEAEGEDQLDSLGNSNSVGYHVWNNKQWLVAANAGGSTADASISLIEVDYALIPIYLL
jgi:hypothetical protein